MVEVGIRSILNFAPTILSVPEGVDVRRVDLSSELQILAYHEQRKATDAGAGARGRADGGRRMSVLVVGISHKTAPASDPRAGGTRRRGRAQADPRGLRQRARHRGHRALHLQPHRGVRRRRPLPRQRRGDLPDARRAGREDARGGARAPLRALRRRRGLPPVPRRRRPRLDGASARARSSARPARRCGWARRPAPSARRSTSSSSRPCASASARTPRPTSTGSAPSLVSAALDTRRRARRRPRRQARRGRRRRVDGRPDRGDRRRAPVPPRSWWPTGPPSERRAWPPSTTPARSRSPSSARSSGPVDVLVSCTGAAGDPRRCRGRLARAVPPTARWP